MSPADALLLSWRLPVVSAIALLLTAGIYLRGWSRARRGAPKRFQTWRAWCFLGGLAALFVAISSPLDAFAGMLLQAHMVQHLLLTMVAPPLLLLGNPLVPMLRGVPRRFARHAIGPFLIWPPLKRVAAFFVHPLVAWGLFQFSILFWHLPQMYELALRSPGWHEVEHASFLGTGILFWWFIIRPWPSHETRPLWWAIPYLLFADLCNTGLAAFLSFNEQVLYPTYALAPRLWGISALEDQAGAGAIMWVPGSAVYLLPVGLIISKLLQGRKGVRPSEYLSRHQPQAATKRPEKRFSLPAIPRNVWLFLAGGMRWLFLGFAVLVVADGLLGPSLSPLNLAGVLPWTYWRGFGVIALLFVGNLFCLSCPMILIRNLWRKMLPARFEWPRLLRNKWPAVVLLLLFLWIYEAFALWDRPASTAWLVIGYFVAVLLVDGLFHGASFCKYVCPVGQYHFVLSMISPATIRPRDPSACLSCKTQDCIKGNERQNGCELKLFVPRKSGNADCTLCLDCVKACDNVTLAPAFPSDDWERTGPRSGVGNYARRIDFAALIAVLVFGAFFNSAGMLAPVLIWEDALVAGGIGREWLLLGLAVIAMAILPAVLGWLGGLISRASGKLALRPLEIAGRFAPALVPIGAAMWASHFVFHLLTGLWTAGPAFERALGGTPRGMAAGLAGGWIQGLEVLLLDAGLLLSWYGVWRIGKSLGVQKGRLLGVQLPWLLLVFALWGLGLWIVFQPMQMRGTMGTVGH